MKSIKRFMQKFLWWLKRPWKDCRSFCPTCKHFTICKADYFWCQQENQ